MTETQSKEEIVMKFLKECKSLTISSRLILMVIFRATKKDMPQIYLAVIGSLHAQIERGIDLDTILAAASTITNIFCIIGYEFDNKYMKEADNED